MHRFLYPAIRSAPLTNPGHIDPSHLLILRSLESGRPLAWLEQACFGDFDELMKSIMKCRMLRRRLAVD